MPRARHTLHRCPAQPHPPQPSIAPNRRSTSTDHTWTCSSPAPTGRTLQRNCTGCREDPAAARMQPVSPRGAHSKHAPCTTPPSSHSRPRTHTPSSLKLRFVHLQSSPHKAPCAHGHGPYVSMLLPVRHTPSVPAPCPFPAATHQLPVAHASAPPAPSAAPRPLALSNSALSTFGSASHLIPRPRTSPRPRPRRRRTHAQAWR